MKKMIALLLALIMVFSLVACSSSSAPAADTSKDTTATDTATTPADTAADTTGTGASEINVCLASEPDTVDPALNSSVDGATMLAHLFSGLAKWAQDENGNL